MTALLHVRAPVSPAEQDFPVVETMPVVDTWIDGILEPIELVGRHCFRTTMFARVKLDGLWVRDVRLRIVREIDCYRRNQLGDMLTTAQAAIASGLLQ